MDCHVNKELLHIKLVYFSYLGAFACMLPYIPVFFLHIGLSVWQVGVIRSLEPILTFVCSPIWGALSDRFSKHRVATTIAISGAGIFYCLFLFVPLMTGVSPDSLVRSSSQTCPGNTEPSHHHPLSCGDVANPVAVTYHQRSTVTQSPPSSPIASNSSQCQDLCAAGRHLHDFSNKYNGFAVCYGANPWVCSSCDYREPNHSKGRGSSLTVYGVLCSAETHERNGSAACSQAACCQCGQETLPNPKQTTTFVICIVLTLAAMAFNCNILMFFDATTMELLKGRRKDYGKSRVWGAVSWGTFAPLSGVAIDLFTKMTHAPTDRFEPTFIMFFLGMAICACVFANMRLPEHKTPQDMKKDLRAVLCKGEVILFLCVVMVMGVAFVMSFTFVFIFIHELHSPYLLLGLAVTLTAIAEIPFMYFSGKIIKRVGYAGVMYMTLIAYALRYFGYSLVYNPWAILPIQLLHGITYGLAWPMCTAFANTVAPRGMAATLQSIVACCFMGVGAGIGNIAGGIIYEQYGARTLFRCVGGLCTITLVIFFIFTQCVLKKRKPEDEQEGEDGNHGDKEKPLTKDAPVDAVDWDQVEKNGTAEADPERMDMLVPEALLTNQNANQNNTSVDVHSANI